MQRDATPADAGRAAGATRRTTLRIDGEEAPSRTAIVVGHDGERESEDALQVAKDLASRLRAHLHIVHARDVDDSPVDPDARDFEDDARRTLAAQRSSVRAAMREHETGWTYHAGRGDPAELLARVADEHEALMIVVGSRGEGWHVLLERIVSPAVTHRLIERAGRPVLVVGPSTAS